MDWMSTNATLLSYFILHFRLSKILKQGYCADWSIFKKSTQRVSKLKTIGEIVPFAETWVDLETVIQNEVSQKEKNKYCITSLICRL